MRYARPMTPDPSSELADARETKDDEVLEREGMEEELMQQGRSEVGEQISDAEQERKA